MDERTRDITTDKKGKKLKKSTLRRRSNAKNPKSMKLSCSGGGDEKNETEKSRRETQTTHSTKASVRKRTSTNDQTEPRRKNERRRRRRKKTTERGKENINFSHIQCTFFVSSCFVVSLVHRDTDTQRVYFSERNGFRCI